ncbi:hypothetical protein [Neisseria sp. CCUG12390]|uniref:hypothetical protein n=1 Tax=Neisseria sp. CCUG12390 TaxID=3392035 RepID=UPI003A0FCC9C
MTKNANQPIPAKRYFTLDEVCQVVQISPEQFARWQYENAVVIGYGGDRYTRSDIVKLLKLKETFAPYAEELPQEVLDANGLPAADNDEIRASLNNTLADLEKVLAS